MGCRFECRGIDKGCIKVGGCLSLVREEVYLLAEGILIIDRVDYLPKSAMKVMIFFPIISTQEMNRRCRGFEVC